MKICLLEDSYQLKFQLLSLLISFSFHLQKAHHEIFSIGAPTAANLLAFYPTLLYN